jgi:hypothetical protein
LPASECNGESQLEDLEMELSIDTDASVAIGFVEVLEHSGAFLLVEVRGGRAWWSSGSAAPVA